MDPKVGDLVEIEFSIAGMVGVSKLKGEIAALSDADVEILTSHPRRTIKAPLSDLQPNPVSGWSLNVDLGA